MSPCNSFEIAFKNISSTYPELNKGKAKEVLSGVKERVEWKQQENARETLNQSIREILEMFEIDRALRPAYRQLVTECFSENNLRLVS